jgi:hypothetical protein
MKTKYFSLLLVSALFLFACQKEVSQDTTSPTSPTDNDSTVLSKLIVLDTLGSSVDTMNVTTFEYDNLNRLAKTITINYSNNAPDLTSDYFRTFYSYNGADTLANKITYLNFERAINDTYSIIHFFTRNASQTVTRDSSIRFSLSPNGGDTSTTILNFTFYPDSIIEKLTSYTSNSNGNRFSRTFRHEQTKTNGNIVREIRSIFNGTNYFEVSRLNYTFDTKLNPFIIFSVNYPTALTNNVLEFYYPQKNNPLETVYTSNSGLSETEKYIYTYNNLGYPKTVIIYNPANPATTVKGVFIYTK